MYYRTAIVKQLQIMKFPTGQFFLQEFNKEAKGGVKGKLLTSATVPVVRDTFENTQWRKVETRTQWRKVETRTQWRKVETRTVEKS